MNSCSLLIPCHNAADYLPRLWKTIEAQTVRFDEIICYDDGSTDDTVQVAESLGAKVIKAEKCQGAAHARNQLAKVATSDWIHFHDADDTLHPEYLEKSKNLISNQVDVIVCHADWIDEQTHHLIIPRRYQQQELAENPLKSTLTNPIGVISVLCRREMFLAIGGFDEYYVCWEDADLHVQLAANGARFAVVEEVLTYSLRHDRGLSSNQLRCKHCRLKLLQGYAHKFDSSLQAVIAGEAEKVARGLLGEGDYAAAQTAIKFCQSLGGSPPQTNNSLLKILKFVLPAILILRFQYSFRHSKRLRKNAGT